MARDCRTSRLARGEASKAPEGCLASSASKALKDHGNTNDLLIIRLAPGLHLLTANLQHRPWHICHEDEAMPSARHVRIFKNGRNQAIRIPREMELSTSEVTIHRDGNRLVIEPVERTSLLDMLSTWGRLDVDFSEPSDEKPDAVEP
jgi:antitoxin VapB